MRCHSEGSVSGNAFRGRVVAAGNGARRDFATDLLKAPACKSREGVMVTQNMEGKKWRFWPKWDRWICLSASMVLMGCNGLTYTYAIYSEHLKQKLHYGQEQIDDIGAAKDFGAILGVLSGILYNFYPPWVTVSIGGVLHLIGYGMVYLTLMGKVSSSLWMLCVYSALGVGGDGFVDTAAIMTSVQNFDDHPGTAMGIIKAQVGISGGMFVVIYDAFLEPDVERYLLLVTLVPAIAYFLGAFPTRPFLGESLHHDKSDDSQRFSVSYGLTVFLGLFLMVTYTVKATSRLAEHIMGPVALVMVFTVIVLYTVPVICRPVSLLEGLFSRKPSKKAESLELDTDPENGVASSKMIEIQPLVLSEKVRSFDEDLGSEDDDEALLASMSLSEISPRFAKIVIIEPTLWESLTGLDFWLVTFVVMVGGGTGLAIINNFAQIGKSLGTDGVDLYVGLISIWSCFGRLLAGFGSDYLLGRGYPRPFCLFISQMIMTVNCILLATGGAESLYLGSALVGLSYGSYWSLTPPITSEIFGLRHFTSLYKIMTFSSPVGAYLLSAKVVGSLYDKEASVYQASMIGKPGFVLGENNCMGPRCFSGALVFLAAASFTGALASLWFTSRTKKFYSNQRH